MIATFHEIVVKSGPILESRDMHVIFQKKGKKEQKNVKKWSKQDKIFENLG